LALTEAKKIVDGCNALAGTTGVPGAQRLTAIATPLISPK